MSKGALLFKDDNKSSKCLVECSTFLGFSKGDDIFYNNKTICTNLIEEYIKIKEYIVDHSANGFIKRDSYRDDYIFLSWRKALDEAIIYALINRNYLINGTQIQIDIFKDKLEIVTPGSLIGCSDMSKERNLSKIPLNKRNEVIFNVFKMLALVEKEGCGFQKIEKDYSKYDAKHQPFVSTRWNYFSITLPDLTYQGIMSDDDIPAVYTHLQLEGKNDLKILSYCYRKPRTVKEIANFLNILPSTYFRKEVINRLVDTGYLIATRSSNRENAFCSNKNKVFPS